MLRRDGIASAMASFIERPAPIEVDAINRKSLNSSVYFCLRLSARPVLTIALTLGRRGTTTTEKSTFLYIRNEITSPASAVMRNIMEFSVLLSLYVLRSVIYAVKQPCPAASYSLFPVIMFPRPALMSRSLSLRAFPVDLRVPCSSDVYR